MPISVSLLTCVAGLGVDIGQGGVSYRGSAPYPYQRYLPRRQRSRAHGHVVGQQSGAFRRDYAFSVSCTENVSPYPKEYIYEHNKEDCRTNLLRNQMSERDKRACMERG